MCLSSKISIFVILALTIPSCCVGFKKYYPISIQRNAAPNKNPSAIVLFNAAERIYYTIKTDIKSKRDGCRRRAQSKPLTPSITKILNSTEELTLIRLYRISQTIRDQYLKICKEEGRDISMTEYAEKINMTVNQLNEIITTGERARQLIISTSMRSVYYLAKQYQYRGLSYSDLIQEGFYGLQEALVKFNPDFGVRFMTFATYSIDNAFIVAIKKKTNLIRIPSNRAYPIISIKIAEKILSTKLGRKPNSEEISNMTCLSYKTVEYLR